MESFLSEKHDNDDSEPRLDVTDDDGLLSMAAADSNKVGMERTSLFVLNAASTSYKCLIIINMHDMINS